MTDCLNSKKNVNIKKSNFGDNLESFELQLVKHLAGQQRRLPDLETTNNCLFPSSSSYVMSTLKNWPLSFFISAPKNSIRTGSLSSSPTATRIQRHLYCSSIRILRNLQLSYLFCCRLFSKCSNQFSIMKCGRMFGTDNNSPRVLTKQLSISQNITH